MAPIKVDETDNFHNEQINKFAEGFKYEIQKNPKLTFAGVMASLVDYLGHTTLVEKFDFAVEAWNRVADQKVSLQESNDLYESMFGTLTPGKDYSFLGNTKVQESTKSVESTPVTETPAVEESLNPLKSVMDEKETVEKKNFKTSLGEVFGALLGGCFFIAFFGFIGYAMWKDFISISQQYQFLTIGIFSYLIILFFFYIFIFNNNNSFDISFDKTPKWVSFCFILFPIIFFCAIIPIFIILIKILIFILSFWFIWFAIVLLIQIVVIWFSSFSILKKTFLTALIILTMYFFFEAKDILEFHFQTFFDNESYHILH